MTFNPINVVNGTTPANATWGNNAQTQYTESILSFGPDAFAGGWVLSGLTAVKDLVTASKLDLQAGTAYLLQSDGTTRQRAIAAQSFTTSVASTTYFLDINPDGSLSFGTSHSGVANHLTILSVTTDGSANISTITDARPTGSFLLSGFGGVGPLVLPTRLGLSLVQNNSFAGVVNGVVTFGQVGALTGGTPADPNGAALFNGTNGWINCPIGGLPTSGSFSIETLAKISANPAGNAVLMLLGTFASQTCFYIVMNSSGQVQAANDNVSTGLSSALSLNVWHHLVATYDGAQMHLYVDGTQVGTGTTATVTPTYSTVGVALGQTGTGAAFFPGQLDECAPYGTALSAARVSAHNSAITAGGYLAAVQADNPLRLYRLGDPAGSALAQDTIPATSAFWVDAGGGISSVGGVSTAGPLGVPAVVASALRVPVTVTTLQTIASITPAASGFYRANFSIYETNPSSATLTAYVAYTDPTFGATTQQFSVPGGVVNGFVVGTGAHVYACEPLTFYAEAGQAINVNYQSSTGTPADFVSAIIERLA